MKWLGGFIESIVSWMSVWHLLGQLEPRHATQNDKQGYEFRYNIQGIVKRSKLNKIYEFAE